ncbi:hypothetical protein WME90_05655 [Sorangium sp. So ce375]|uniref:hypothetical protein n=1 Tax=Sorangium sp. So ce375 TaxID=3133306 RepID=UPI003F5BE9D3
MTAVADASIMPDIISAPTNVTTIMIAEAISRKLRGDERLGPRWTRARRRPALSVRRTVGRPLRGD